MLAIRAHMPAHLGPVTLAGDLGIDITAVDRCGTLDLALVHRGTQLHTLRLGADTPSLPLRFALPGILDVDVAFGWDGAIGALTGRGHVRVGDRTFDLDGWSLLFDPTPGEVAGSPIAHPPVVKSVKYGDSKFTEPIPCVMRLHVDELERHLTPVGRMVRQTFFRAYPDFVFNVVACVGADRQQDDRRQADAARADGDAEREKDELPVGVYGDPTSIWFNVFFGYYQIDAPKPAWNRPFGYESAAGVRAKVAFEDVVRLGKSDWNYFSNWMYGVPRDAITPYDGIDIKAVLTAAKPIKIGTKVWHEVRIGKVEVVSAFQSSAPGAAQLTFNCALTPLWQLSFGLPSPCPVPAQSFVPTVLESSFFMSYFEDDETYHTVMFGGTNRYQGDPQFLQAQLDAALAVIKTNYPMLGFAAD